MPLTCTICKHPDRTAIERLIIRGTALREVAEKFRGTTNSSLHRHKHNCLGAALVKAKDRRELASGGKVLAEIETIAAKTNLLYDTALELVQEARDANKLNADKPKASRIDPLAAMDRAIALLREARANAGLIATITGDLGAAGNKGSQVAIMVYPQALPLGAPCDLSHRPGTFPIDKGVIDVTPLPPALDGAGSDV